MCIGAAVGDAQSMRLKLIGQPDGIGDHLVLKLAELIGRGQPQ